MEDTDLDEASTLALSSSVCTNRFNHITRFITELEVGGVKDSVLGYKEGLQEAMKSFTNVKTYSLPW